MNRLLLGFSGKPRHGKDSCALAISKKFPTKIYSVSDLICEELGVKRSDVKDVSVLQRHSFERRQKEPYYFIERIWKRIQEDADGGVHIIPNIRLLIEADYYRSKGFELVRITRLNASGSLFIASDRDMNDPLETELDHYNFDYSLTAKAGDLRWLEVQAINLVQHLSSGKQEISNAAAKGHRELLGKHEYRDTGDSGIWCSCGRPLLNWNYWVEHIENLYENEHPNL